MAVIENKTDAVSKVYAQALFDTVFAAGGHPAVEKTHEELTALVGMAQKDPKLAEFLSSRIISVEERSASLGRMLGGSLSPTTVHFIQLLNDKGRLHSYRGIVSAFDSIAQQSLGRIEVEVYTASEMGESDKAGLARALQEKLGKPPVMHMHVEPSMIGGIRIQVADHLIDASLSTRLSKLREQLATNGLPAVRAAADRIFKADPAPSLNGH